MVLKGKSPGKDGVTVKYIQKRSRLSLGSKPLYRLTVKQVDMSAGMNLRDSVSGVTDPVIDPSADEDGGESLGQWHFSLSFSRSA
jgi:hypothetical protein